MTRWILGLSAGRTGEGVDALLAEIGVRDWENGKARTRSAAAAVPLSQSPALSRYQVRVADWLFAAYPRDLRDLLAALSISPAVEMRQIGVADRVLGEFLAQAAGQLADRASVSWQRILCAGCAAFPLWHDGDSRLASSITVGAAAILAERTGITVLSDFAGRDLASGGQGEPLDPLADAQLFGDAMEHRLIVHLGATTHAVYLPALVSGEWSVVSGPAANANHSPPTTHHSPTAWVVGPGTLMLDSLVQHLTAGKEREDVGGKYAVQGRQIPELLDRWTNHPFLRRRPPKTAARSTFADGFAANTVALARQNRWAAYDLLCTANHLVAWAIADSVRRWMPKTDGKAVIDRLLLTGAGVRNGLIWRLLQEQFPGVPVSRSDELGFPAEPKEALDAAMLACLALDGIPASLPSATGASGSRLLGGITPGSGSNWARCLQWMTGHGEFLGEDDDN